MDTFIQQLINGLTLGSIYAMVALGYSMVYGIIQLINFAHGEVVMFGAMTSCTIVVVVSQLFPGLNPFLIFGIGVAGAIPVCMLVAYLVERFAYRPLRHAQRLAPLITAIGMSIILQNLAMMIWGRNPRMFPQTIPNPAFNIAGATLNGIQLIIMIVSIVMMVGLVLFIYRTRLGAAMRATAESLSTAQLMGIPANRIIVLTFIIGAALAAIAGSMVGLYYGIAYPTIGWLLGLKAFAAAVLGGIGNIAGTVLGGLLLGVIEAMAAGYIGNITDLCHVQFLSSALVERCADGGAVQVMGSNYVDVFSFLVLVLVLTLRPSGLLGERIGQRD